MVDDVQFSKMVARLELLERQVAFLLNQSHVAYVDRIAPDQYPDVADQKRKGNMIEAIKLYRTYTGASLIDAKRYVDNMNV
jgi:ribosomal protein L7/L12